MIHLFTHNDLDGVGCGIVAKYAFGDKAEIRYNSVAGINFQVGRWLERMNSKSKKQDMLFITDLSVNEEIEKALHEFSEAGGKVMLIDHHKTALHYNKYAWAVVQVEHQDGRLASATSLLYEYLKQEGLITPAKPLDEFVQLVRQYDTWEWEKAHNVQAKRLNDLFFLLALDDFEQKMLDRIKEHDHFVFDEFEKRLLEIEEEKIERYVRRKRREMVQHFVGELCVGIVHAESYHSELGNELGKENTHLDYIAIINMGGKKISFRTIHDHIDVSMVAGEFGGGGHAKAAGCTLTEEAYAMYVEEPFPLEPVRVDAFNNSYNLKSSSYGTLYGNRMEDTIFVFATGPSWSVDINGDPLDVSFHTFEEAERFIKRHYAAWLARDEIYIKFLLDNWVPPRLRQLEPLELAENRG